MNAIAADPPAAAASSMSVWRNSPLDTAAISDDVTSLRLLAPQSVIGHVALICTLGLGTFLAICTALVVVLGLVLAVLEAKQLPEKLAAAASTRHRRSIG